MGSSRELRFVLPSTSTFAATRTFGLRLDDCSCRDFLASFVHASSWRATRRCVLTNVQSKIGVVYSVNEVITRDRLARLLLQRRMRQRHESPDILMKCRERLASTAPSKPKFHLKFVCLSASTVVAPQQSLELLQCIRSRSIGVPQRLASPVRAAFKCASLSPFAHLL